MTHAPLIAPSWMHYAATAISCHTALKALIGGVPLYGNTYTDDLVLIRQAVMQARARGALVTGKRYPDTLDGMVTFKWGDAVVYDIHVTAMIHDDDEFPWYQRLGLNAAEVVA